MATNLEVIKELLSDCSAEERSAIFAHLREEFRIHPIEDELNVRAEVILEAIHRASDLSIRGVRGLIAEASFEDYVVKRLEGWAAKSIEGDMPYDFVLSDRIGPVHVQVKMQRLEKKRPKLAKTIWRQGENMVYVVETQKTRSGRNEAGESTRPYRFGEFDIIAVSMHPSTHDWSRFNYTIARWLLPRDKDSNHISTFQPVPAVPDEETWTTDFLTAVRWFRESEQKTIWVPPTVEDRKGV